MTSLRFSTSPRSTFTLPISELQTSISLVLTHLYIVILSYSRALLLILCDLKRTENDQCDVTVNVSTSQTVLFQRRQMSSGVEIGRKGTLFGSILFSFIGAGLSIAAILTPSWQVVNLREYNSIHEHGLWLDCTRHSRDGNHILQR